MSGLYEMMTLGAFTFGVETAAYQELRRVTEYLWPSQNRFGNTPVVQAVGIGDDTIQLPGVIYPEWNGGTGMLDYMRDTAAEMQPMTMIDGRGNVMGRWVIERVEEGQSIFAQAGVARKQEFSLSLKKFDDQDAGTIKDDIASGVQAAASAPANTSGLASAAQTVSGISTPAQLVASVTATANAALATAGTIATKVGAAIGNVNRISSALGIHSPAITKALNRSMDVVSGIRVSANESLAMVGRVQTVSSATTSIQGLFNDVSTLVQPAASAGASIKSSLAALTAEGASPEAISVTTDAMVSANSATHTAYSLQDITNQIMQKRIEVFGKP